ncbi:hypothetical protein [Psychroserpens luteolus]|uniref:hypothetical protein n=1 Tax=Psychroserpens luteolus TaxID=2855840 RepID=UPI001E46B606|nr:hypothetical protein [Psychroserpens luteolus]MCD2258488.1 hypothetical protein [Psychroserpens luteolus]
MNHIKIIILVLVLPLLSFGQDKDLSIFENLVDKTWSAEGQWENNGPKFKQDVHFSFDLERSVVIAKSKGFVNKEQTEFGDRNHGVRHYDKTTNTIKFWEFDVFGNVTKGKVLAEGKNIIYQYQYGESIITDMWEYVDDSTYNFKVGSYYNGTWEQVYLNTVFKEQK